MTNVDVTRYALTYEHRMTILEIEFESGPDSTEPDHICREVPWPDVARSLAAKGLADYSRNRGWVLTYNGRKVYEALVAGSLSLATGRKEQVMTDHRSDPRWNKNDTRCLGCGLLFSAYRTVTCPRCDWAPPLGSTPKVPLDEAVRDTMRSLVRDWNDAPFQGRTITERDLVECVASEFDIFTRHDVITGEPVGFRLECDAARWMWRIARAVLAE